MRATFVELPAFERLRQEYLDDEGLRGLQLALLANPRVGDLIQGTGGLRKVRRPDPRRGKGTRGGLRVIYYWWDGGEQFWLFTVYDKDVADDLTADQRKALAARLRREEDARQPRKE
ncbi:MAG: toxin [Ramlibacter sp.]